MEIIRDDLETAEQKAAREAARAAREAEMKAQKEINDKNNLEKAKGYYNKSPTADNSHPYLQKKGIESPEGLKHYKNNNTHILYIPIFNKNEELQGVQRIFNDGNKGIVGKVAGGSFTIGDLNQAAEKGVILAEGYATAYALHKHSNMPVVVGFNSHNIVHVAESLKEKLPDGTKLIIAADNDVHLAKEGRINEGVKGANAAAMAYGDNALVMLPPEYPAHIWQEATKDGKTPTDFDDAKRWLGGEAVKQAINEAREKIGLTAQQENNQNIQPQKTAEDLEFEEAVRIQRELNKERIAWRQEHSTEKFQQPESDKMMPPPMTEEEWAAQMAAYQALPQQSEEYDRYQSFETSNTIEANQEKVQTEKIRQPELKTATPTATLEEYEKKEAIEKAIKESDLKEQIQHDEAPDTPREQTEKAAILASSPEFRQFEKKAEPEQREQSTTEPAPKPQQNQQTEKQRELKIPEKVSKQYEIQGNNERKLLDKETHKVAIDASSDNILKTRRNDTQTIKNMLEIATNNGWSSVKIKGSNQFKREAWLQASLKGLEVNGYKPTEADKQLLKTRQAHLEKSTNSIINETSKQAKRAKPVHKATGKLVAYGVESYPNSEKGSKTYYADIQTADGNIQRLWGKGIQEALKNSNSREGDMIHLAKTGNNGKQNTWKAEVLKTVAQQNIETARTSGNPTALKAAQQSFAKEHLAARSAQILQQNHEKVQQAAGMKPEQSIPKPPQAKETTPKKTVSPEITR